MFSPKNRFRVRLEKIQHLTPRQPTGRLYPVGYEHEGYIWTEEPDLTQYLLGRKGVGPVVVLAAKTATGTGSGAEGAAFRTSMVEDVSRVRSGVYHVRTPNSVWQVVELPEADPVEAV
ncbi:MAG TPA: hypothetical protein VFX28_01835 [Methylomirabilota bacterium]|nr:hypothetical protein [Methylomirabilota bacterium]